MDVRHDLPDTPALAPGVPARADEPPAAVGGAAWLALGAVASKSAQTVVLLVFAAVLAPDAFGVVSLGAVLLNVTTVVAGLGTSTALVHFRGDAERAARSAVTIALATSSGLVLLVWATAPGLAGLVHAGDLGVDVFRGVVLCVPLAAVAGVSAELLRRSLDFRRRVVPDIVGSVAGAVATIGALAAGEGAFSLVYGQLTQAFVVLLLLWWLRPLVRLGWSRDDATKLLSYGLGLSGGGVLTLVMLNVDYVLIANRLGTHDVGVYSMAFRIAYMPYLLIAMVIGGAVFAHLCRMRGAAVWRAIVDAAVVLHALVVPAYVGVIVLAPQLELLGHPWAAGVPALRWLAAYGLVLSALELLLVSLRSVGRTADVLGLGAFHLGALLVLLLLLVDRGVTAAAIAQFVAGVATLAVAALVLTRRVSGAEWTLLGRRLLPVGGAAVALAATALLLQLLLPWPAVSVPGLLVCGAGATAAYVGVLLLLDPDGEVVTVHLRRLGAARAAWYAAVVAAALGVAVGAVVAPATALLVLLAAVVVGAAVVRVEWAAVAYVAAEPFGDLLRDVHPAAIKVAGGLLFLAWLVRLVAGGRPALRHPGVAAVGVLALVVLASFVAHGADLDVGLDHTVSYGSYALVVVVLVDTVRRAQPDPLVFARRLALTFALSCTAAGAVGVADYLAHGGRASGPLSDPNDLAFFMVAALPLLLVAGRRSLPGATAAVLGGVVLVVAVLATLSRGALVGLVVMGVVALLLRAVRPRTAVAVVAVAAVATGALWFTHAAVVDESIHEKEHIAATNVDLRVTTSTMAATMTAASPLLGQGPGGFAEERDRFVPAGVPAVDQTVAHQMYLDVAAELGLLGLAAFLAVIAYGVRGAVRGRRWAETRPLADAVLLGLAGTLAAACFLSEQLYLPVWLLVALGIALDDGAEAQPSAEQDPERVVERPVLAGAGRW
ncbi:oligosaccharide flippase family protein [Nocardioides sp. MH1]|uniref:oligosaccharide flippase family protein n=1 Tax=Nocardioides sp. MH1 TaxID=3242490 RepID=UPI003522279D